MQVGPENRTANIPRRLQKVMVIVPINAHEGKAEHVAHERRDNRHQGTELSLTRGLQIEHHDGDDNRQHAVAEGLESSLAHGHLGEMLRVEDDGSSHRSTFLAWYVYA